MYAHVLKHNATEATPVPSARALNIGPCHSSPCYIGRTEIVSAEKLHQSGLSTCLAFQNHHHCIQLGRRHLAEGYPEL